MSSEDDDYSYGDGSPIFCPNKDCGYTTTSYKDIDRRGGVCPNCGASLKKRAVPAPNLRGSLGTLSCVDCASFHRTTTCTGFGAKLEGMCNVFYAGIISADDICDAIDPYDPDYQARKIFAFLDDIPQIIARQGVATYILDRFMKDVPIGDEMITEMGVIQRTGEKSITVKETTNIDPDVLATNIKSLQIAMWDVTNETKVNTDE